MQDVDPRGVGLLLSSGVPVASGLGVLSAFARGSLGAACPLPLKAGDVVVRWVAGVVVVRDAGRSEDASSWWNPSYFLLC